MNFEVNQSIAMQNNTRNKYINTACQRGVADTKLKDNPICRKIGPERSLFVGKLELCTPPTIVISFASALRGRI